VVRSGRPVPMPALLISTCSSSVERVTSSASARTSSSDERSARNVLTRSAPIAPAVAAGRSGSPPWSRAVAPSAASGSATARPARAREACGAGRRRGAADGGSGRAAPRASPKPLIAAIEGFAVAGGFEIALACDLIVAARGAKLGIPEVKRSLVAAGGALLRLPRVLPRNLAMELALTGDPIDAERGYELALVNRLAEP